MKLTKNDKSYTNGLIIYGKVMRFSSTPQGQHLRLVDMKANATWKLDDLLKDFEDKNICAEIKLIKKGEENES